MSSVREEIARALLGAPLSPHYRAIGEFLVEFSQVEYVIKVVYFSLIGAATDAFEVATTQPLRNLCSAITVLAVARHGEDKSKRVVKLLGRVQRLADERNHIAHAYWHKGGVGLIDQYVSNSKMAPASKFQSVSDIEKATAENRALVGDILEAYLDMIGPSPTPQNAPSEPT